MKSYLKFSLIFIALFSSAAVEAQTSINGKISDSKGEPVIGANIFILGTIEGTSSNTDGIFSFKTSQQGTITLVVSFMGYEEFRKAADVALLSGLNIILKESHVDINQVEIVASNFNVGQTQTLKKMNALDIVMTGSSNGDIYAAIQTLPGTQKVGEDGKLYIRGGASRESQTFIDGMHVLMPYSTTASNMPARGRFSPFLFKGINYSLGGYNSEYGQALSSVLPMETKDFVANNKFGISLSPFSIGAGGTNCWSKSSLSFNSDFMNMETYNQVFPDKFDWINPYQKASAESQYKLELSSRSSLKFYMGYDYTSFKLLKLDLLNDSSSRNLGMQENNSFLNATYRASFKNNMSLFFGAAYSHLDKEVANADTLNDKYAEKQSELHLKTSVKKAFLNFYMVNIGTEALLKGYQNRYTDSSIVLQDHNADYNLWAAFLENRFRIAKGFYTNISTRLEYTDYNSQWSWAPRFSISYLTDKMQFSGILGLYNQSPEEDYIAVNGKNLSQESASHYILSASYDFNGRVLKSEIYYKDYSKLALIDNSYYTSKGHGYSKGIDLYFLDDTSIKNIRYSLSYSFNDSKRLYKDFPILSRPQYYTKHNFSFSMRYFFPKIKTYLSIAERYASGRPYEDPNKQGFYNSYTSHYNSLDMNGTFLLNKSVILYTSVTNILNRENVYQYNFSNAPDVNGTYRKQPVTASRDRFFYIFGVGLKRYQ